MVKKHILKLNQFIFLLCIFTTPLQGKFLYRDRDFSFFLEQKTYLYDALAKGKKIYPADVNMLYECALRCEIYSAYMHYNSLKKYRFKSSVMTEAYLLAQNFGETRLLERLIALSDCDTNKKTIFISYENEKEQFAISLWDLINQQIKADNFEGSPFKKNISTIYSLIKKNAAAKNG